MKKRVLSLSLIAMMLLSSALTACTGNTTDTDQPAGSSPAVDSTAEGDQTDTPEAGEASWDNLGWKNDTSPITFSCYLDFDWYAVDTWGNDEVSQEITRRTGVSLDVTKGSDLNQLGVLLASGDLPDIIFMDTNVQRFEDADISAPWDELIAQYCPELMPLLDKTEIINNTREDGHFYTLKTHYKSQRDWDNPLCLPSPGDPGLFFRGDVLDAIGNPQIKSIEELKAVFTTVKEKSSELGIDIVYTPHPSWPNAVEEFFSIGRGPFEDGDMIRNFRSNPAWKDYFLFMNELYREGLLYKEYLSARPEDFFQLVRSGKTFAATYNSGVAGETNKIYEEQGIDGYWVSNLEALTVNGETRFALTNSATGWASCFISADSDKHDRLINYMAFLKSPEGDHLTQWGIEDKHYTLNEDGLVVSTEYRNSKTPQELGIGPWYFQASGLTEAIVGSSAIANPDPKQVEYAKPSIDLLQFRKPYYTLKPVLAFARSLGDSDEFMIEVKIADEWNKRVADIILADSAESAAALYDEMMSYLKTSGMDQLEQAITENYNKALVRYQ